MYLILFFPSPRSPSAFQTTCQHSVLLAFSTCWWGLCLISVLIWNNSRGLHQAIPFLPSYQGGGREESQDYCSPPPAPPAAAASIVPCYLLPSLWKPAGLAAEDTVLLIRIISLIYERMTQWRSALPLQPSFLEAGHPPSCWQCRAVLGLPTGSRSHPQLPRQAAGPPTLQLLHLSENVQIHATNIISLVLFTLWRSSQFVLSKLTLKF